MEVEKEKFMEVLLLLAFLLLFCIRLYISIVYMVLK